MIAVFFFILGLCIGSFLNVVAYRIPENKSIVKPNSFCPECKKPIKPYNNIPLLSYLILKAKCSECGEKISIKYPLVELTCGLLFLFSYLAFGLAGKTLGVLILISLLLAITVTDIEHQLIPDKLILFGLEAGFIMWLISLFSNFKILPAIKLSPLFNSPAWWSWVGFFGGAIAVILITLISSWLMKAETMGGGDIKLAALIGFYIGPYVFLVLALSFVIGALVTVPLLLLGKIKRREPVPFGPFIALAGVIIIFFGPAIWNWYFGFLV